MQPETFCKWCESIQGTGEGRRFIFNARQDVKNKWIDKSVVRAFCREVVELKLMSKGIEGSTPRSQGYLRNIVAKSPQNYLCKGEPISCLDGQCSRIVPAEDFFQYNVNLERMGWADPADDVTHPSDRLNELKEALKSRPDNPILKGEMAGRLPIAWVTKTSALRDLLRNLPPQSDATQVRDALGLNHFHENEYLIEVRYPKEVLSAGQIKAPTFLDGGTKSVFRSQKTIDKWGCAMNLHDGSQGLPEGVHEPIDVTNKFTLEPLGEIRNANHNYSSDPDRCPCGTDPDRCAIMEYLKSDD